MNEETIKQFLTDNGISVATVAAALNMPTTVLNNKLNPKQTNKLTELEKQKLLNYLQKLQQNIASFLEKVK